jgi:hypothetical protein
MVSRITPRHGLHGKRSLNYWDVLEPFPRNGRGTDLQKTSYVIVTSLADWRVDCCLATFNNIRNSIVACVYSVARSVAYQYTLQYHSFNIIELYILPACVFYSTALSVAGYVASSDSVADVWRIGKNSEEKWPWLKRDTFQELAWEYCGKPH